MRKPTNGVILALSFLMLIAGIGNAMADNSINDNVDLTGASYVYKINGSQVLGIAGTQNLDAGALAGDGNSASYNTFVGYGAADGGTLTE